jgi:TPR repeat protein/CHAT domain-containing protein
MSPNALRLPASVGFRIVRALVIVDGSIVAHSHLWLILRGRMSAQEVTLWTLSPFRTALVVMAAIACGSASLRGQALEPACDRLAAAPTDPSKVGPGVPLGEIDAGTAIPACEEAVRNFPSVARFHFQLGRALSKAGRDQEAVSHYEIAVTAGYAPAAHNLAILYLQHDGNISNPDRGLFLIRFAAEAGFPLSQYQLGKFYVEGMYVERDLVTAAEWFRKAAERGEPSAQNDLGYMYKTGAGVTQDITHAIELFRRSAGQGNSLAQYNLGVIYENGTGTEPNAFEAAKWYTAAAGLGHRWAQNNLAVLYQNGRGVEKNPDRAIELFRAAAAQGHVPAEVGLGKTYEFGLGVPVDKAEAVRWYTAAADHGDAWAQNQLGLMYQNGNGVPQDYLKAFGLYKKAAEQGNAVGEANVGFMYAKGFGVPQDYGQAAQWYSLASEQGNSWAQNQLGVAYQNGLGLERDDAKAVELYRKAADQGNPVAQANLGFMYANGLGIARDYSEAARWYGLAADQGNAWAQDKIGNLYKNGQGVDRDYKKALEYFQKSVALGYAAAAVDAGLMYEYGFGVPRDYSEAAHWYGLAAEKGNAWAQNDLGLLYFNAKGVERDFAKALELFRKAAAQGNAAGLANEGFMYANGYGVAKDYGEATKRYRQAAAAGNGFAMSQLAWLSSHGTGVPWDGIAAYVWYRRALEAGYSDAALNLGQLISAGPNTSLEMFKNLQVGFKQGLNFLYTKPRVRLLFKWPTFVDPELRSNMVIGRRLQRTSGDDQVDSVSLGNRFAMAYAIAQDEVLSMRPELAKRALTWTKGQALTEAASWLEKAIQGGSKEALLSLANLYLGEDPTAPWHEFVAANYAQEGSTSGAEGLPASIPFVGSAVKAAELYEQAIDQGSDAARINLAILYELGHGRQKDLESALRLYRESVGTRFDGQAQFGLLRNSFGKMWEAEILRRRQIANDNDDAQTTDVQEQKYIIIQAKSNVLPILIADPMGRRIFSGDLKIGQQYRVPSERNDLILWLQYASAKDVEIRLGSGLVPLPSSPGMIGVRLNRELLDTGTDYLIRGDYEKLYIERTPDEVLAHARIAIQAPSSTSVYVHGENHLIGFPQEQLLSKSRLRVPNIDGITLDLRANGNATAKVDIEVDSKLILEVSAPADCLVTLHLDPDKILTAKAFDLPDNCSSWSEDDPPKPLIADADNDFIGYIQKLPSEEVRGVIAGFLRMNRGIALLSMRLGQRWDEAYRAARIFYAQDLRSYGPNSFNTIESALNISDFETRLGLATAARARLDGIVDVLNRMANVPLDISVDFFRNFGSALSALGHYTEAEHSLVHAVALQEKRNRIAGLAYWYNTAPLFDELSKIAANRGDLDNAILYKLEEQFLNKATLPERSDEFNAEIGPPIDLLAMLHRGGLEEQFSRLLPYLYHEAKREIVRDVPEPLKFPLDLSWAEATFGSVDHSEIIAGSLGNLGQIYSWMGRYSEALPLEEQLAKTRINIYGESNPQTSIALAKVADEYRLLGANQEAVAIARRAFAAAQSFLATRRSSKQAVTAGVNALRPATFALLEALYAQANSDDSGRSALDQEAFNTLQHAEGSTAALALQAFGDRLQRSDAQASDYIRRRQDLSEELGRLDAMLVSAVSSNARFADASREDELKRKISETEGKLRSLQLQRPAELGQFDELTDVSTIPYTQLRLLLHDDEVVTTFISSDEATFVFLASRQQLRWVRINIGAYAIERMVATLRCGLDQRPWESDSPGTFTSDCLKLTGITEVPEPKFLLPFRLDLSNALYQVLFALFEDEIKDKHLIVIPTGPVAALPLQVLVTEKPATPVAARLADYKSIPWLGTRQPISVLPSVSSLSLLRKPANADIAPEAFIGFANPLLVGPKGDDRRAFQPSANACSAPAAMPSRAADLVNSTSVVVASGDVNDVEEVRKLAPLPETAREICAVALSLGAPESATHIGNAATETVVKDMSASGMLARARVIEFATHALLPGNDTSIERGLTEPALVLTPPPAGRSQSELEYDDGLLTASEVAQLNLNADWVVLSACNTAGGESTGGEALSGLARAFFFAGTRALLVSHWEVDSEAAVKLTTRVFAEMHEHPDLTRSEGLRRSMAALVATGGLNAHPSVWAPFVLVGD